MTSIKDDVSNTESNQLYTEMKNIINGKNGTYRIDKKKIIGKGSFSTVYIGTNVVTYEKVAIKKYFCNKMNNYDFSIIEREIKIVNYLMKRLIHENLVKYLDVIQTYSTVYIIMEYCTDGTLSSLLVKPMKEKYIQYYFKQIVEGLKVLHNMNIIHRDIKPDNILLSNDYKTIKICDFGFSHYVDDNNDYLKNMIYGSPIYMAPESFITDASNVPNADTKCDIWSAGIILYEMIYGYHPCKGSKDIKTIQIASKNININKHDDLDVSNEGINLLRDMLNLDKMARTTIENIIDSVWLKSFDLDNIKVIVLSDLFKPIQKEQQSRQSKSLPNNFSRKHQESKQFSKKKEKKYKNDDLYDNNNLTSKTNNHNNLYNKNGLDLVNDGSFDLIIKEHNKNQPHIKEDLNKSDDSIKYNPSFNENKLSPNDEYISQVISYPYISESQKESITIKSSHLIDNCTNMGDIFEME